MVLASCPSAFSRFHAVLCRHPEKWASREKRFFRYRCGGRSEYHFLVIAAGRMRLEKLAAKNEAGEEHLPSPANDQLKRMLGNDSSVLDGV